MRKLASSVLLLSVLAVAPEAGAVCSVTATGVSFGNYDAFVPTPLDSTGTIDISCETKPPIDVTVSIGPSTHSGVFNPRQMKNTAGPTLLNYNIHTNKARTTVWGDGTGGSSNVVIKGTKKKKLTMFGSISPGQNVPMGTYDDIVTVTIVW